MSDKKPASKISYYPITAAIWRNDGPKGAFYSVSFERTYKDKDGKYQTSNSFTTADVLLLAKVADLAHTEMHRLRENDHQAQQGEDAEAA